MVSEKGKKPQETGGQGNHALSISKVELLGIGSARYQQLKQNLTAALKILNVDTSISEITDIDELMSYDVGGIPAVLVDNRVIFQRVVPSVEDITDVLRALMQADPSSRERIMQQAALAEINRKASVMKKILVPTDFSHCSMNALGYAVDIANQFGCKITLLHTYKMYSTSGMFVSVEKYIEKDAAENLLQLINKIEPKLRNGASIESRLVQGDAIPIIADLADKYRYDLVIMGTKGANGLKEVFMGSITNGVINAADTPVLAVPEDFDYQPIDRIVFAVDDNMISHPGVTTALVKLVKGFGAKLDIFHQSSKMASDGVDPSIDMYLDGITPSFHYELNNENLIESLYKFVDEYSAGLLCMVRRKRGFIEQVFHTSATAKTVYHAPVPLLILKDKAN